MQPFEHITLSPRLPAKSTVIWLHGLGADGHDFVDLVPELHLPEELAVRFIFPHAPIRPVTLNGGFPMRAWFDVHGLTEGSQTDDEGVLAADKVLHSMIQHEHAQGIALDKIIMAGFSQGAAMALYTGLHYPKRLGGILALSGFLPLTHLHHLPQQKDIPIFMAHGVEDTVVACRLDEASRDRLTTQGYQVEWHQYPMGHGLCEPEIRDISRWLIHTLST